MVSRLNGSLPCVVYCAAKLGGPFKSAFVGDGKLLGISSSQIECLCVQQYPCGITVFGASEIVLHEIVVGHQSIRDVAAYAQPISTSRNIPVAWQGQAYGRHRVCIDAQRLRSATQFIVFKLHGVLLGTYGKARQTTVDVGIELLNETAARIVRANCYVGPIAKAPMVGRVGISLAFDGHAQIAVLGVYRRHAVFVGCEPQGCFVMRIACLCFGRVSNVMACALQCILCRGLRQGSSCYGKHCAYVFDLHIYMIGVVVLNKFVC